METRMRKLMIGSVVIAAAVAAAVIAGETMYKGTERLPAGVSEKVLNDQNDIRSILAEVSSAALTKGSLDDLVERIATPDRKRFGTFFDSDSTELDGRIEQIQKAWKGKYGVDLKIDDRRVFDGFVTIIEGEITDETAARLGWPVPARGRGEMGRSSGGDLQWWEKDQKLTAAERAELDRMTPEQRAEWERKRGMRVDVELTAAERAEWDRLSPEKRAEWERNRRERAGTTPGGERLASERMGPDGVRVANTPETVEYLKNGRNVAVVYVEGSHGLPPVMISMIRERIDSWRIDLPDDYSAQRLADNLKTALTEIGEKSAEWPADVNEGYRMVGHRLLLAINDVPAKGGYDHGKGDGVKREMGRATDR